MKVKISGLTKQDYIISRLLDNEIVVHGNPRAFKALKGQMSSILSELQQLTDGTEVSDDLIEFMAFITQTMKGLKDEE